MGQPITTNPLLIALINMTVVFAVLYGLSLLVGLIKKLDPTVKKATVPLDVRAENPVEAKTSTTELTDDEELLLLFTAAIAAYGCANAKIVAIRPLPNESWTQAARFESIRTVKQV